MPFQPGQSGNPTGRPKMSEKLSALQKAGADKALAEIIRLSQHAKSEKIKLAASQYLVDRQYGRAVQPVGNEDDKPFILKML